MATTTRSLLLPSQRLRSPTALLATLTLTLTLTFIDNAALAQKMDKATVQDNSSSNSNSGCSPETDCLNGYCQPASMQCECYPGFAGFQCERACPPGCGAPGSRSSCQTSADGEAYCACDENFRYVAGSGCVGVGNVGPASGGDEETATLMFPSRRQLAQTTAVPDLDDVTLPNGLRPLVARTCIPGFVCVHGQCAPDFIGCICDEGWSGAFCCEICSKNCTDHGRCMIHLDGTSYCACDWYYTGEFCEADVKAPPAAIATATTPPPTPPSGLNNTSSSSSSSSNITAKDFTSSAAVNDSSSSGVTTVSPPDPSSSSSLRSLQERTCVPGFVCLHGRCGPPPDASLTCACDPGWSGVFCQEPCDLDCGRFGMCRTVGGSGGGQVTEGAGPLGANNNNDSASASNGSELGLRSARARMYCSCVAGYTGPRCETSGLNDTAPDFDEPPMQPIDWDVSGDLRPLSERECVVGFVCLHGRCAEGQGIQCTCDPGYVGVFCHVVCPLDCSNNGVCDVHRNGTAYCKCKPQYTGADCSAARKFPEAAPGDSVVQWYVVGACGAVLLILLVLLVALPYWMWKRGHIFMMKVVYHFKSFEDDDKKLYDAFISHSHADHNFVATQLFPRLTQMNFKVCVHQKDFIAGETIANNIIQAVDNSRRTLLVLTPDFLRSEFCRFEYQQAQYQMIRQRQRIVPIVLRDVDKEKKSMDPTLRSILETITYLDYPQDGDPKKLEKFWKRLELSMPKRKDRRQNESTAATTPAVVSATTTTNNNGSFSAKPSSSSSSSSRSSRYNQSVTSSSSSTYCRLDSTSSGYSTTSSRAGSFTSSSVPTARPKLAPPREETNVQPKPKAPRSSSSSSLSASQKARAANSAPGQGKQSRRASRGSGSGARSGRSWQAPAGNSGTGSSGRSGHPVAKRGVESVSIEMDRPENGWDAGRGHEGYSNPVYSGI